MESRLLRSRGPDVNARRARLFGLPFGLIASSGLSPLGQFIVVLCAIIVASAACYWIYRDFQQRR